MTMQQAMAASAMRWLKKRRCLKKEKEIDDEVNVTIEEKKETKDEKKT